MPFSSQAAALTVQLSRLAYAPSTSTIGELGLTNVELFDRNSTGGFLASDQTTTYLAFKGSNEVEDWLTNARFLPKTSEMGVQVHSGFVDALDHVWQPIATHVNSTGLPVVVTGHSLGGALASLAALRLFRAGVEIRDVYTYGQPRVGTGSFRNLYDTPLGSRTYRFINHIDLVTRVPLLVQGYRHVGQRMYFDEDGGFHPDAGSWQIAKDDLRYRLSHLGRIKSIGLAPHLIGPYQDRVNSLT